jgi:hypothetical protein
MDSIATTAVFAQEVPFVSWGDNLAPAPNDPHDDADLIGPSWTPHNATEMERFILALYWAREGNNGPLEDFFSRGKPLSADIVFWLHALMTKPFMQRSMGVKITITPCRRRGKPPKVSAKEKEKLYQQMRVELDAEPEVGIDAVIAGFAERTGMARSALYKVWSDGQAMKRMNRQVL